MDDPRLQPGAICQWENGGCYLVKALRGDLVDIESVAGHYRAVEGVENWLKHVTLCEVPTPLVPTPCGKCDRPAVVNDYLCQECRGYV